MLVLLPLVQDIVPLLRLADGIQHIAVALAVHSLLEGLDGQAQVHFICRNVFPDIWQVRRLDAVQEDQEGQDLVIGSPLCLRQFSVILDIHAHVDLFRYPEVIHGLPVPVADPVVLHIVKIIQIRRIAAYHPALIHLRIPGWIKQRLFH